ncbi:hypothetical protein BJ122_109138 [Rhodopseudomonas faecalis]|uniref:Uncharacterized protein n=1 Tax=Rhodopseudomonas faecalis TaxID=99655 RepID=A0A318TMB9_9BRAD|nr:hypothetical protein BJ122_109138 [Rhodopseudomonas faecalis]
MANEARRGLLLAFAAVLMMGSDVSAAQAPKVLARGDVLSGQLNAMRSRVDGKRVSTFQIVSEPRRLPPPGGLCNLETGPQTFQLVTANDEQAAQLKKLLGKEIKIRIGEVSCADEAGQISEAVVKSWSVVGQP